MRAAARASTKAIFRAAKQEVKQRLIFALPVAIQDCAVRSFTRFEK
jgi:hypothetical protein